MKNYGVWITNKDGSNGRWMSNQGYNLDMWLGSKQEAEEEAITRQESHTQFCYSVRSVEMKPAERLERIMKALALELPSWFDEFARGEIMAAFDAAVCNEREACARIAEAPFTGQPHTEYSKGKMDAANTIAKNIRARNPEGV